MLLTLGYYFSFEADNIAVSVRELSIAARVVLGRYYQRICYRLRQQAKTTMARFGELKLDLATQLVQAGLRSGSPAVMEKGNQLLESRMEDVASLTRQAETKLAIIEASPSLKVDANNSAVDVYMLHTLLRQRFGRMMRNRKVTMRVRLSVAEKLRTLRPFNENLFVGFKAPSHRFFRDKLLELQKRPLPEEYRLAPRVRQIPQNIAKIRRVLSTRRRRARPRIRVVKSAARASEPLKKADTRREIQEQAQKKLWEEISGWLGGS
jgi:hypothetical protein